MRAPSLASTPALPRAAAASPAAISCLHLTHPHQIRSQLCNLA